MKDPRQMTFGELKKWLSDHLQMRGAAAADINMRRDESPYERPVELWKSSGDEFRSNFKRAVMDLVAEAGATPWEPEHFHELGLLLEAADLWEAVGPLEDIAHSTRLLSHEDGPQLHMLALRTLLALRWKGTLDFWLAQKELVGTRWPGIIFEGLAQQDVEIAFEQLPDLVSSGEAMREVLNLFPGLMRDLKVSISSMREMCRDTIGALRPEAAEAVREWFRLRNYPLGDVALGVTYVSLSVALRGFLGNESEPRVLSPMLCARANGRCLAS